MSTIKYIKLLTLIAALFFLLPLQAQIKIGGNVYGGGNAGDMTGSTSVTIYAGDLNEVYGGARQANVGGSSFVNIDGSKMSGDILINYVYGGNDISGTIGEQIQTTDAIPTELTEAATNGITPAAGEKNAGKNTKQYNAFVLTTPERTETTGLGEGTTTSQPYGIFIGQLFGGGNGDYTYKDASGQDLVDENNKYIVKDASGQNMIATSSTSFVKPELGKAYLELRGGTFGYVYGGGNNATVTSATDICIDNSALVTTSIPASAKGTNENKLRDTERLKAMGIPVLGDVVERDLYHFSRVFGGNNKADMAIQPKWHLKDGNIENLYSGGNEGRMTCPNGLLLEIMGNSGIMVDNVYGGCRKADVFPSADGTTLADSVSNPAGYNFPIDLAARVLVRGGDINNVYGGNDISGKVYFGNAVGVYTSIRGDIYGGGNGSYAYTDNPDLKGHIIWGDYYYDPGSSSVEALNAFRPNAEQVSIRVVGSESKKTVIGGGIYVGGNSATLVRKAGSATQAQKVEQKVELKIGSYVIADKVFLGNNGENMVKSNEKDDVNGISEGVLRTMASKSITSNSTKFNSINLTDADVFAKYMEGCAMDLRPQVVFDNEQNGDPDTYQPFTSYFGSFFCGGNVGSMTYPGTNTLNFNKPVYIYNKVVGGCNNAFVQSSDYNASYEGGITEALTDDEKATNANKLVLKFNGTLMKPMRLKSDGTLEWNTKKWQTSENAPAELVDAKYGDEGVNAADLRLDGGNVYGGCYTSGYVNGNVEINILSDLVEKDKVFGTAEGNSGVDRVQQYGDVLGTALNVFGAGYGEQSEIRGSTTINITDGYAFQTFGGGEKGKVTGNCTTNLKGGQVENIYGGGMEGNVEGSVYTHLGDGQCVGVIGGACNANIGGHTEVYIGDLGFPTITEDVYGGNDFGGKIEGTSEELGNHIRDEVKNMVTGNYGAASYVEYRQGSVRNIFGGCYGSYNYEDKTYKEHIKNTQKPYLRNAFVNFRPDDNKNSKVAKIFGAGEGYPGDRDGDKSQDFSYVLIDIPENVDTFKTFKTTEVFGAGAYDGLGMRYTAAETFQKAEAATETTPAKEAFDLNTASAVIDLMRGRISAAYGGSLDEGVTRRTLVNVPSGSTIKINNIFGGAYGNHILPPCDVYEANVNYRSGNARVNGGIYGGNNNVRRTIYATVNISVPVLKENGYNGTVYGAGKGLETWAEYTEVNLESGANVYEAYGGSEMGNVLNAESVEAYMNTYKNQPADKLLTEDETEWNDTDRWEDGTPGGTLKEAYQDKWKTVWKTAWTIGDYYIPNDGYSNYVDNQYTNLTNAAFVRTAEMDDRDYKNYSDTEKAKRQYLYNTNVIINKGATVGGYVYGGGLGDSKTPLSGGIYGSTYVAVLGGTVAKDVYAAGTSGSVSDVFGVGAYNSESNTKGFTASANVYVMGGTVRNVYGGGWEGHVGHHEGAISASTSGDRNGETHVVVGVRGDNNFLTGAPAVTRNVYGGGEGGSVYGKAYVTINNGHIGYRYVNGEYKEELDEKVPGDNVLDQGGNVFGGGYVANSYTDASDITMWGGQVRGCLYGGGELGPIGRGTALEGASQPEWAFINNDVTIYKGGETHIFLYGGHVMRNVFGGGRGFDNWNGDGTKYMSEEVKANLDLSSKGYVFGSTDVHIRGGEIGTHADVAHGLEVGNVFGGGNQGFVYSATGTKHGDRGSQAISELSKGLPATGGGYYYKTWYDDESKRDSCELSLDCNVVVEPYCLVTYEGGISGFTASADGTVKSSYSKGEYVPLEALNQLQNKEADARWAQIDYETGITIHNAVFAGGNVTVGSDQMYVNTGTVFGNVTAALRDVYHRDLITIGTEHTGGIYGDGNLTMVDGWREIHIDNYGTDYYTMETEVSKADYEAMSDRERAYFVLNYKTNQEITGTKSGTLAANKRMTLDEIKEAFDFDNYQNSGYPEGYKNYISEDGTPNSTYFTEMGFCSIYAGRLLNTIQRCDMAAVWGSRIVLQGARDRVPEKADYTRYTLNRVGELSLNQRISEAGDPQKITVGSTQVDNPEYKHGNYFGIYSVVNYLGNLTSDVFFTHEDVSSSGYTSIRTTDNANSNNAADGQTYYDWKLNHAGKANRNNATSPNKVCLASGVYLELIREESEKSDKREWGLITGVVELDLIDVKTGLGGGYVYARNQHGKKEWHRDWSKVNLSPYNEKARTYKRFTYDETETNLQKIETSGNFVHNTKQIIDDCYPNANAYVKSQSPYSEAHYWYIKGLIYVYDQYISAYTGTANAYAETVNIPLTIAAASHGRMTLRDVQPNLYAYKGDDGKPLGTEGTVIVGDITYRAGDPIDYWTYSTLSTKDQAHFVPNVYTTIAECQLNGTTYPEGSVLLPTEVDSLKGQAPSKEIDGKTVASVYHVEQKKDVPFDYVFRVANKISHDAGFALTYDVNNPSVWNNYYTKTDSTSTHISTEAYAALSDADKAKYTEGPTYHAVTAGVYGQRDYEKGEIISKGVYDAYQSIGADRISQLTGQATADSAYVITSEWTGKNASGTDQHLYEGTPVFKSDYTPAVWAAMPKSKATLCTSTLQLSETEYVYAGDLLSTDKLAALKTRLKNENSGWTDADVATFLNNYLSEAYYITKAGKYGGRYYNAGEAYRALDAWCSLSETDRENFRYNYDALDLLIDPDFEGTYGFKPQYDGFLPGTTQAAINAATTPEQIKALAQYDKCTPLNPNLYSKTQPIDYEAEFSPTAAQIQELGTYYDETTHKLKYKDENNDSVKISTGYDARIKSTRFEDIPNERAHWSPIIVTDPGTYYVVKEAFINGDLPYTVGQQIDATVYNSLTESNKGKIRKVNITDGYAQYNSATGKYDQLYYYYCRESYKIGEKGEGTGFYAETNKKNYVVGDTVPTDIIIKSGEYDKLVNLQKGFIIHGTAPEETTTLYVSRETDIFDLQKEKIITVIYLYEYQESDESGNNITPVSERHIVNIHINFESGAPEIGPLTPPGVVLPGTTVGLKLPRVEPGAFEISSSGWEIFDNEDNALLHVGGKPYINNATPMYWYQNGYWVAYYAQTYLGKTYSEPVQFTVANYHDLKKVMDDKEHHYYIDHKDVDRKPKIYINDYSQDETGDKNGLDLFRDLIDLTHREATYDEHHHPVAISDGSRLDGHTPLERTSATETVKPMRGGKYLDIIMHSNQDHAGSAWTPIANGANECFSGTLHGDGYTITGLNNSLFNHLCGNVYNLGVRGTFTGAGIAETGEGYVENCWISSSSTEAKTSKPIFGSPTGDDESRPLRIVNSYYLEDDDAATTAATDDDTKMRAYANHTGNYGTPTRMSAQNFYNGTVAYDLNGFYLYKRYSDKMVTSGTDDNKYDYYTIGTDGKLNLTTGYYGDYDSDRAKWCSAPYVEGRFADGDFRYADGVIPETEDERTYTDEEGKTYFYPIWPDDYLYFGQTLTYGYDETREHQDVPSHINRFDNRVLTDASGNRVYRAPAYYRSKTMGVAHFNPAVNLAAYSKPKFVGDTDLKTAYPQMTAIDFKGHNDATYKLGLNDNLFYQPLLDDDGIVSIANRDETRNLLVYAPTTEQNNQTLGVLTHYFTEPAFQEEDDYRNVKPASTLSVFGHLVNGSRVAVNDHLLVDRQDFNAPIAYTFDASHRAWYQRLPDNYAGQKHDMGTDGKPVLDQRAGWESISLPFSAELVTTDVKGEITHFYQGNTTGHEYWLREYRGKSDEKVPDTDNDYLAQFSYPSPGASDKDKEVGNTFLWDYYYQGLSHNQQDANQDIYQTYYNTSRTYLSYPRLTHGVPYIIGFPGARYYEFDLSGAFEATTTYTAHPEQLSKQTITFASATAAAIGVSDEEMTDEMKVANHDGYFFHPNYLNIEIPAGQGYVMSADGDAYSQVTTETVAAGQNKVGAFRTYFSTSQAPQRAARRVIFSGNTSQLGDGRSVSDDKFGEGIDIYAEQRNVVVTSKLRREADVRIFNASGLCVASFTVKPGETVETPVHVGGVYVVHAAGGRYRSKLMVKSSVGLR